MKPLPDVLVKMQIELAKRAAALIDMDDETFQETLESETYAVEHCEMLANATLFAELESQKLATLIDLHRSRQLSFELKAERLRQRISKLVETTGKSSLPTTTATLVNTAHQRVEVDDVYLLPDTFRRQPPPEPHKLLIKAALKNGEDVPGCRLGPIELHLQIRAK
jgi:hypothetical protein